MNARTQLPLAALAAAALLCAHPAAAQTGNTSTTPSVTLPVQPPRQAHDRNRITAEDIAQATGANALLLVQSLHPQWLRARGVDSFRRPTSVMVYQDGMQMGGAEALRRIPRESIAEIHFVDGMQATQRWGLDHGAGAIEVTTR